MTKKKNWPVFRLDLAVILSALTLFVSWKVDQTQQANLVDDRHYAAMGKLADPNEVTQEIGLSELQEIALSNPAHFPAILDFLVTHVQITTSAYHDPVSTSAKHSSRPDAPAPAIKRIVTVIGNCTRALGQKRLAEIDLHNSDLREGNLSGAHLEGAALWGAYLSDSDLRNAHLQGADLQWASLERADLTGANLLSANVTGATYDRKTRWPSGYDAKAHGAVPR